MQRICGIIDYALYFCVSACETSLEAKHKPCPFSDGLNQNQPTHLILRGNIINSSHRLLLLQRNVLPGIEMAPHFNDTCRGNTKII